MSNQIEMLRNDPNYKIYRTSCECMNDDHIVTVYIESDIESGEVVMELYQKTWEHTRSYSLNKVVSLFETFIKRVKVACRILFLGYIETTSGFIFRGTEHIDEFCDNIQKAKEDILGK